MQYLSACVFPPGVRVVLLACILLLFAPAAVYGLAGPGQERSDLELLSDALCSTCGSAHHAAPVLIGNNRHWLVRYNPVSLTLSGLMFVYQRYVSPQLSSQCLYEHTCSGFSIELIETYGLPRGMVLTADRLSRCNRVAAIDIHPLSISETSLRVIETVEIYKRSPQ